MEALLLKTLGQIVSENPNTAAIFENHNIDFCCKGKRTLQEACNEKKIPVNEILEELEKMFTGPALSMNIGFPPDQLTLTQLSNHIVATHHEYVRKELPWIFTNLEKIASKHGANNPNLYKIFDLFIEVKEELEAHLLKEEQILFPRIREIENLNLQQTELQNQQVTYLQTPISVMEHEHDHAGTMMSEIRKLTNNYEVPDNSCPTYKLTFNALKAFELDLHQHVHLENNILFEKAIRLFENKREAAVR
jgi:regulator of cell morphogenesis and NO signaling